MTARPCLAHHASLPALAGLGLLATLAAAPAIAGAQDAGDATWETPAAPLSPPSPAPRADGLFSLEGSLGTGTTGAGAGLRASLGFESEAGWRLELGAGGWTESGTGGITGGELLIGRAMADVSFGRRMGRVEPWVAFGVARYSAEFSASGPTTFCFPGTIVCGTFDTLQAEGASEATGAALAAGVRIAFTESLLGGVTLRKLLVDEGSAGTLGAVADPGAPWFGLTVAWRPRGGR